MSADETPAAAGAERGGEAQILQVKREKIRELRAAGVEPFPWRYQPTHSAGAVRAGFEALELSAAEVSLAGRVMVVRDHGKTTFFSLQDQGERLQVYVRRDELGEEAYERFRLIEAGDVVGVRGPVFRTRTGEITVRAREIALLAKAVRPLPEKWHGLRDIELRSRQRYLDLLANPESRAVFLKRSAVVRGMRQVLEERGFLEVETPVLQPIYGGAAARPFVTHHNALGMRMYLRIANELYLKRLVAGGLDRVYEFSRDFRNEGMDRTHNPEFTQVEAYQAYADYTDMMELCEALVRGAALAANGGTRVRFREQEASLDGPWPRERLTDLVSRAVGAPVLDLSRDELAAVARRHGLEPDPGEGWGFLVESLFEALVEPGILGPLIVMDYPRETSPLAKRHRDDPRLAERFEPFLFGTEFGNAFSELNDPEDQERAMREQAALQGERGEEAHPLDLDYIRALEHGMPPTGGLGVGIDRLVMFLTDRPHIRDVILFPHLRPLADGEEEPCPTPSSG